MNHFSWRGDTLVLSCVIQPKARRDEVVGLHNNALKIRITAPPVGGQANRHLIGYLSKLFDVPKKNVNIARGLSSREKTVTIVQPRLLPDTMLIVR